MKSMTVLIDANVILDYVTSREPSYHDAYKVIEMCHSGKIRGHLAFHSVSIIWYVLRKYIPDETERRLWMKKILQIVRVTGASHEAVMKAVEMDNFKDFEESMVKAITPSEFCKMIEYEGMIQRGCCIK